MSGITSRVLFGVLLAGGVTLLGAAAANAAETTGEDSILGGTQVAPIIEVPVNIGGVAVGILGDSTATGGTSAPAASAAAPAAPAAPRDAGRPERRRAHHDR